MVKQRPLDTQGIHEWTAAYEEWLATQVSFVVAEDIEKKHEDMTESPFVFLRATYYAWAQLWPAALPRVSEAPQVTSVGDLHLENFGTWRDTEGRLAWGINDFDEASVLPYTNDLVRLATSVALAYDDQRIRTPADELCRAFLESYRECLELGGRAVVFGEEQRRLEERILRDLIRLRKEKKKGEGKTKRKKRPRPIPADCQEALERALPAGAEKVKFRPRVAGVGSLGRPRFVATTLWNGGPIMREAKARVPSAVVWAHGRARGSATDAFDLLLRKAVRSADPFLHLAGRWVIRRLAADTDKIEISIKRLPGKLEVELTSLMGQEVANVHLATEGQKGTILQDLKRRPRGWLLKAAEEMAALTEASYKAWKKARK